jgi:hypothetical protein
MLIAILDDVAFGLASTMTLFSVMFNNMYLRRKQT